MKLSRYKLVHLSYLRKIITEKDNMTSIITMFSEFFHAYINYAIILDREWFFR